MSYYEFEPQTPLPPDIKCLWSLEEDALTYNADSIAPDSYVELIVNCGAPLFYISDSDQRIELPRVFLKGLQKKPLHIQVTGLAQLIGVRFYPWRIPSVFNQQQQNGDMPITPLMGHWPPILNTLNLALKRGGYAEVMAMLQQLLWDRQPFSETTLTAVRTAGHLMYDSQGQIRINDLAVQCSLSASQLERQFKAFTGVTPKTFARLVRFEAIRDTLMLQPTYPLADLAYTFGYTDQAHFIHDFKGFAERTPSAFAAQIPSQPHAEFLQSS